LLTIYRNNGNGLVAGACIGVLAVMCLVFVIVHFFVKTRRLITEVKLGMKGRLGTRNGGARITTHQEEALEEQEGLQLVDVEMK
jgi:hypothetical protein